jgi:hypothetical protein
MANTLEIEIDEETVRKLVYDYIQDQIGADINTGQITIEVKSKQNYRAEWETAEFRAKISRTLG